MQGNSIDAYKASDEINTWKEWWVALVYQMKRF
jgi:hypothetical protein